MLLGQSLQCMECTWIAWRARCPVVAGSAYAMTVTDAHPSAVHATRFGIHQDWLRLVSTLVWQGCLVHIQLCGSCHRDGPTMQLHRRGETKYSSECETSNYKDQEIVQMKSEEPRGSPTCIVELTERKRHYRHFLSSTPRKAPLSRCDIWVRCF